MKREYFFRGLIYIETMGFFIYFLFLNQISNAIFIIVVGALLTRFYNYSLMDHKPKKLKEMTADEIVRLWKK